MENKEIIELLKVKERLSLALTVSNAGVWEMSVADKMMSFDEGFARLMRIPWPSPISIPQWADHIAQFMDVPKYQAFFDYMRYNFDGTLDSNFRNLRYDYPDGTFAYTNNSSQVFYDANGKPERVIGMAWDVTQDVLLMEQLEEANRAAEAASQAKSDFLSRMSHEIRTPINAIIGMSQIGKNSDDSGKISYCFDQIDIASRNLLGLINQILDMSKIEANKVELNVSDFNFTKMINNLVSVIRVRSDEKGQKINIKYVNEFPKILIGDEFRISQIITNFLSNAVKFTPENGEITICVREVSKKPDASEIEISVTDTGIGIEKEDFDKLFIPFEQLDGGMSRKFEGTGLGLIISEKLVHLMGGKIDITSEVGKGSTFSFKIILPHGDQSLLDESKLNSSSDTIDSRSSLPSLKGKTILIAEDNKINMEIVLWLLEETGAKIEVAYNGKEAFDIFTANPAAFDMIFMDVNMPEMNGYEATAKIRKFEREQNKSAATSKQIPIIAMTANVFREDIVKCLNCGMTDHIAKPFNVKDFDRVFNCYFG